jgi:multidrug efflux pump subunit AcrA (membrane-fusion protein)
MLTLLPVASVTPAEPRAAGSVHVDAAAGDRLGLRTAPLAATHRQPAVRGFGHFLDPGLLAAAVYDYQAARAAFDATDREYERVQALQRANANASQRDLESARATRERERAALGAAEARLIAAWGEEAARRDDLPALAHELVAREAAVARIDLPLGTVIGEEPVAGRVRPLAEARSAPQEAAVLDAAPDADPLIQGRGVLLLIRQPAWPPGTAVDAWLELPGPAQLGVDVPSSALLRVAGATYVYLRTGDQVFLRRAVHLDRPTRDGWFVRDGLAPGDVVVVTGAQALLSTELGDADEPD